MNTPRGDAAPSATDLAEPLNRLVRWMARRDVQEQVLRQAGCPVPLSHTWLLGRIGACGRCHPSQLAELAGVDNSTITPKLHRLEAEGLIRRETDPQDRRAVLLAVTTSGARMISRLRLARATMVWTRLQALTPERRSSVVTALLDLSNLLEEEVGREAESGKPHAARRPSEVGALGRRPS